MRAFVSKKKAGVTIAEVLLASALASIVLLGAGLFVSNAFKSDVTFRESLPYYDAVQLVNLVMNSPKCGRSTFVLPNPDKPEEPIELTLNPTDSRWIPNTDSPTETNLSELRVGNPASTFVRMGDDFPIKQLTLIPLKMVEKNDFGWNRFHFLMKAKGLGKQPNGSPKDLSVEFFITLNANPEAPYNVVNCGQFISPPIDNAQAATALSSYLTANRKNNATGTFGNQFCPEEKLLVPLGLECAAGFLTELYPVTTINPVPTTKVTSSCSVPDSDTRSLSCWRAGYSLSSGGQ